MDKLAYDYSNRELMEAYWEAVARAAVSNSGLVIDFAGGFFLEKAYYLHGIVLSRLEGKERPFTRGDHVHINPKATYMCRSINAAGEYYSHGAVDPKKTYEVDRVFYEKDGTWALSFKGDEEGYRYTADRFEKVEQKKPAVA
ncbi:MAG TPA: hypothetical protein VMR46_00930 [Candidatus Paceibacterota bacterium]|nr:hypothetical protein [Candidatus Paceibacterota bacterium]